MCIHSWSKSALLVVFIAVSFPSFAAGIRKNVSVPSATSIINNSTAVSKAGNSVTVRGPLIGEHIPATPGGTAGTPIKVLPTLDISIPRTITQVRSILGKGGLVGLAGTVALQALLDQIGAIMDEAGNVKIKSTAEDTSLGGYYWALSSSAQPRYPSAQTACEQSSAALPATNPYRNFTHLQWDSATQAGCGIDNGSGRNATYNRYGSSCPAGATYNAARGSCDVTAYVPATAENTGAVDSVIPAADPDWIKRIASEACQGALNPAACITGITDPTYLSGPTTVQGPKTTTTTTGPAGTTTTTTDTKWTVTYGPNYFTYTPHTTTTTTKPDGTTETSTTTPASDSPDQEEPDNPDEQYSFEDSAFPEVKPFYEQKYPGGLQGVWDQKKSQVDSSEFISFLSGFVPSFSGSCPSFGLSFHIASWANYGNVSFSSLCYVFDFVKVVLLVSALFLCRALTFGG